MRKLLLAGAALALVLVGCQKQETASASPTPSQPGQRLKVCYIPKNTGNPYFNEEIRGFKEACESLGCEFVTTGPPKADPTSQISYIKSQIQQRVDILAITPNDPAALVPVLDEAKAKGILVICVDADLVKNESHRVAAVMPTDFSKIGEAQLDLLGSQIGYQGDIAILSATKDAPNQNVWVASMKELLQTPKYSKMKLLEVAYGDDQPVKSTTETEALLSKYSTLRGIIAPTSVGLPAAAQSLQIAGVYPGGPNAKNGGIALTGLCTPNQMKPYIEKGVIAACQLWSPYDMGWLACHMAYDIKNGKIKPAEGVEFEVPKGGKHKFEKDNVVNTGPLVTFDKNTVGKYNF